MQWYENEGLFYDETNVVKENYPQFEFGYENNDIILKGEIETNRGNLYKIKIVYPENFPRDEPNVYIEEAKINGKLYIKKLPWSDDRKRIHMYSDNHICWNDRNRVGTWNPDRSTGITAINTVAVWLFSYESYVFDKEKSWLGSDHIR